jgi:hypothetical protein
MERNVLCPVCHKDSWYPILGSELINPNGEYVLGYGHSPVMKSVINNYCCVSCNYHTDGNLDVLDREGNYMGKIGEIDVQNLKY